MVLCSPPRGPCRPTIRPIHPHVAQFLAGAAPPLADGAGPSLSGPRGRGHHHEAEQAERLSKAVALAALHFLAVVTPALRPSPLGGRPPGDAALRAGPPAAPGPAPGRPR